MCRHGIGSACTLNRRLAANESRDLSGHCEVAALPHLMHVSVQLLSLPVQAIKQEILGEDSEDEEAPEGSGDEEEEDDEDLEETERQQEAQQAIQVGSNSSRVWLSS